MAGRLGVIGSNQTTTNPTVTPTRSSGGRLGIIKVPQAQIEQQQQQQVQQQRQQKVNDVSAQADAKVAQSKAQIFNPLNIIGDIGNGVVKAVKAADNILGAKSTRGGKTIKASDIIQSQVVDPAVNLEKQAETSIRGKQTSLNSGSGLIDPTLVKNQTDYIRSQQSTGKISKQQADTSIAKLQSDSKAKAEALNKAEQITGIKYDPSSGAASLLDTVTNATGLGELPKLLFKSAAKKEATRLGRDLTEDEATKLAEKVRSTTPENKPVISRTAENHTVEANPIPLRKEIGTSSSKPISQETKPFAPLDRTTQSKIDNLAAESHKKQPEPGTTRLYQMNDKGADGVKSDQFFKDPEKLANFANGRSYNAELTFKDVPDHQAIQVPGKPDVYKVDENAQIPADKPISDITESTPVVEDKPQGDTVSGNSSRIQQKALEEKLNVTMGDLPKYKSLNMKEQAQGASDLVANDRQKAIDIIDGKANPPDGLHPQAVHQALELDAIKNKDGALLVKLANSHINTELSEGAQKLRIAAERDPLSATEQIRQIQDARAKRATLRGTSVDKELKKAIKVVGKSTKVNTKQDLQAFIKGLEC